MRISKILITVFISLIAIFLITGLFIFYKKNQVQNSSFVSVYFAKLTDKEQASIVPVTRKVRKNTDPVKLAISELLKGPDNKEKKEGYFTEIPASTKLLGIREVPDRIIVDLSGNFQDNGGSASMLTRLKQLNFTILGVIKEKPVYLELDGKPTEYIGGEGIEVPQPLKKMN